MSEWLEEFWGDMLSEEPMRIIAVWSLLKPDEKVAIYTHLQRMTTEEGWAEVQRQAAQAALSAIGSPPEGAQASQ